MQEKNFQVCFPVQKVLCDLAWKILINGLHDDIVSLLYSILQVLHSFSQLSPDFRPRASSNASSCGGRLSPILGVNEPGIDLHDNQVPPMSPWNLDYVPFTSSANSYSNLASSDRFGAEQLAGSLANTMKINDAGCFLSGGAQQPTAVPVTEFNNTPYVMQVCTLKQAQYHVLT